MIIAAKPRRAKTSVIGPNARRDARAGLLRWREEFATGSPTDFSRANRLAMAHLDELLLELADFTAGLRVGLYWPFRAEPDWLAHAQSWRARGIQLLLPVVKPGAPLQFRRYSPDTRLVEDRFGIASPAYGPFWAADILVAPCVGFDERGWRLGFGGGFYDRTLAKRRVPLIGIAFEAQAIRLEIQAHDQPLDALITEAGVKWWAHLAGPARGP